MESAGLLTRDFAEGTGTRRGSAEKESWNWRRHCDRRSQPREFQKASSRSSPCGSFREAESAEARRRFPASSKLSGWRFNVGKRHLRCLSGGVN